MSVNEALNTAVLGLGIFLRLVHQLKQTEGLSDEELRGLILDQDTLQQTERQTLLDLIAERSQSPE